MNKKYNLDKDLLYDLCVNQNLWATEIGERLNVPENVIKYWIYKYHIPHKNNNHDQSKYIGKRIGSVVVTKFIGLLNKTTYRYQCDYDCGHIFTRSAQCIRKEKAICRKCIPIGSDSKKRHGYIMGSYWITLKRGADARNIPFNITKEYINDLIILQNFKCAISGLDIYLAQTTEEFTSYVQTASLDRVDSSKAYEEGNVQWVHKVINKMKMDLSNKELIKYCCIISDHQRNKHESK